MKKNQRASVATLATNGSSSPSDSEELMIDDEATEMTQPRNNSNGKKVSFDTVRVMRHSVKLGDNPSVSRGLPVQLGGKIDSETFQLEEYESSSGRAQTSARKLSKEERDAILTRKHSRSSLVAARNEVREIKLSRMESRKTKNAIQKKGFFSRMFQRKKK